MKQILIISFFLFGLILLETSCCRCGPTPDDHAFIKSFTTYIGPVVYDSLWNEELKYNNVLFTANAELDFVHSHKFSSGFSAFACSCPPANIIVHTTIDSVGVFGNKNGIEHEFTELIAIDFRPYDYMNYNPKEFTDLRNLSTEELNEEIGFNQLRFAMKYPPLDTLNTAFTFRFYNNGGEWFEAVTDSVVITP